MTDATRDRAVELGLLARLDEFGISRLADTTGLDTVRIDTAAARLPGGGPVYGGKGLNRHAARITAVMGCLERTAARWAEQGWILASPARLRATGQPVWGPDRFTEPRSPGAGDHDTISWTEATVLRRAGGELLEGGRVWVPADLVYVEGGRPAEAPGPAFLHTTASGLGAHFDRWSAVAAALLELVEGDAVSRAEVLARLRAGPAGGHHPGTAVSTPIDPAGLPRPEADLAERFARAGLPVIIGLLPTDLGLPVFAVACAVPGAATPALGAVGCGADATAQLALRRALLGLAQARAVRLRGSAPGPDGDRGASGTGSSRPDAGRPGGPWTPGGRPRVSIRAARWPWYCAGWPGPGCARWPWSTCPAGPASGWYACWCRASRPGTRPADRCSGRGCAGWPRTRRG
jgi:ribosomal protein S12 methylthiotransferase accessory factor